jgi:hypothetical protein
MPTLLPRTRPVQAEGKTRAPASSRPAAGDTPAGAPAVAVPHPPSFAWICAAACGGSFSAVARRAR